MLCTHLQVAYGAAVEGLRPAIPKDVPAGLRYLLEVCWEDEAEASPNFALIVSHLADTLTALPMARGIFS